MKKQQKTDNELWKKIFNSLPNIISIHNTNNEIIEVNAAFEKAFNIKKEKIIGKKCYEVFHKTNKPIKNCPYSKSIQTKKTSTTEFLEPTLNKFVRVTTIPILDKKNNIKEIIHIFKNINEEKNSKTTNLESEKKYKIIFDSSSDAIMTLEPPTWNFTSGNPATIKLFRLKNEEEFLKQTPGDLSPKFQKDKKLSSIKAKKNIEKAMKNGSNYFEWTHKKITGEEFHATVLLTKIKINNKEFLQATVRDISKQKEYEQIIKKEKETAEKYLELAGTILMAINIKGEVTMINKKGCEILEYQKTEIIGKNWFDNFIPKNHIKEIKEIFKKNINKEEKLIEYFKNNILTKNNKKRLISWHNAILKNNSGEIIGTLSSGEDITEKKLKEKELKEKSEESEQFNKFAVGRELKMIELKKEINTLLKELGKEPKYKEN